MNGDVRVVRAAARVRSDIMLGILDLVLIAGSYVMAMLIRFDGFVSPPFWWNRFQKFIPIALVVHLVFNLAGGLYRQMWRHASIAEARRVIFAGASAGFILEVSLVFGLIEIPQTVVLLGALLATALCGGVRFQSRLFALSRRNRDRPGLRVVVIGAGEAGASIVREMSRNRSAGLVPVAFLDDDVRKQGRLLAGIPVVGTVQDLEAVSERFMVNQVLLAVRSPEPEFVEAVARGAEAVGVPLKILPPASELLGGRSTARDARDLRIEDLIGRQQIDTDLDAVRQLLTGKCVLITGAGGSIGSEIARQVASYTPSTLLLVDHDDTRLHDVSTVLPGVVVPLLIDVCRTQCVHKVFNDYRPDVVFHAAAYKHVPLLETFPCEAIANNVFGTANVVQAAASIGVERLVLISTDKAVEPVNVMGMTKWLGEQLVLAHTPIGAHWCCVRFGNVLGSRGSVIPTFARQIAAGGPVTVTDPRMTRFFMSVSEAVQLVLQASVFANGGDVFMLEMGQAVNIYDLAEKMIRLSGRQVGTDIAIETTGIRPGEKLTEQLHFDYESSSTTPHDSIMRLCPSRMSQIDLVPHVLHLQELVEAGRSEEARSVLASLPRLAESEDFRLEERSHAAAL